MPAANASAMTFMCLLMASSRHPSTSLLLSIYKDAVTKRCDGFHEKESASLRILIMGDLEDDVENITKK